jgi:tyrosyl-tRNA synthetase
MKNIESIIDTIKQGTVQIIPENELQKKLATGKTLCVKFGADPTAPDLHLGHAVVLSKLRELQDLGFEVIFLIGDFTSRIGDPTGKSKTRPPLSEETIAHNMKTYLEQVGRILDPKKIVVRYNSEWLDPISMKEFVKLCAKVTVARLIEREDFANRIANQQSISFHELLYPIFQAYDSVALKADVEIGGTDQTFNLIMGRYLQEQLGQEAQVVITMPLLEGLDGVNKMSKSLGNTIGLAEPADQAYGKLMSISDKLMWRYFKVLLHVDDMELSQLESRVAAGSTHPMELKKKLAHDVVAKFWSKQEADKAQATFEALFQKHDYSKAQEVALPAGTPNPIWIVDLVKTLGTRASSSEIKRLIESKAVSVDETDVTDFSAKITVQDGMIVKVGKHKIYKLSIK